MVTTKVLERIEAVGVALAALKRELAGLDVEKAPGTAGGASSPEDTLTWRKGQYGDYAFAQNKDGTSNPPADRLIAEINQSGGKLKRGVYTYTHKVGSKFINRKEE